MIGFVSKEKRESCFTRWSTAKHLIPAKEWKQSRLIFAKSILLSSSKACFLCVPFTLPSAAVLPLIYFSETTHLSIFSLSIANGLAILPCPTVKPINSIKLLKVIFSHGGKGGHCQTASADSIYPLLWEEQHWVNRGKFAWMDPEVILYMYCSIMGFFVHHFTVISSRTIQ